MVLVHGPYRRRGLATRLVERAVASLGDRGLVPLLDATPAGEEVYARMGFRPVEALTRWRGQGGGDGLSAPAVDRAALRRLAGLDEAAFGADRSAILDDLVARPGCICVIDGAGDGFLLSRRGRTATQLGPVVARDTHTALALFSAGLAAVSGTVLVDLPDRAPAVAELAVTARTHARALVRPHGAGARRRLRRSRPRPRQRRPGVRLMYWQELPADALAVFRTGAVIPAHPLALDADRRLDERRQRALTRYYIDAGAGGLAVGVHTTQFAIREAGLYRPVLELAVETAREWTDRPLFLVAGVSGRTAQAVVEARLARTLGYHAALVSLAGLRGESEEAMIAHCVAVADEMPVLGFYLQPAVGGVLLSSGFWRRLAAIENVIGIKVAPFDRYRTLDVMHGVAAAGARGSHLAVHRQRRPHRARPDRALPNGGRRAALRRRPSRPLVGLDAHRRAACSSAAMQLARLDAVPNDLLALDSAVTDCNAAFFDVANGFHGAIAGCHEVLRRQGLLEGRWCLAPDEDLSPGQAEAIDRVYRLYPELADDAFVAANLERWLRLSEPRGLRRFDGTSTVALSCICDENASDALH